VGIYLPIIDLIGVQEQEQQVAIRGVVLVGKNNPNFQFSSLKICHLVSTSSRFNSLLRITTTDYQ
jgi:hypothetical protein